MTRGPSDRDPDLKAEIATIYPEATPVSALRSVLADA
jgi:hypothetical protein